MAPPIDELKAVAHPARFSILSLLSEGERNVGEIEKATGISQPSLSQQLAVLRNAGLVDTRKDAKLVFYRLDQLRLAEIAMSISNLVEVPASSKNAKRRAVPGAANFAQLA